MKKGKLMSAVLSGVLVGSLLCAGAVFANESSSQDTKASMIQGKRGGGFGMRGPGFMGNGQEGLQTVLDELVADGTITQDKADKILDFCNQKEEEMKARLEEMKQMTQEERKEARGERQKDGLLSELVDEEIITQEEADAIQEKLQEKMEEQREEMAAKRQEMMKEKYDQLVEEGIISEEQADQIKEFLENKAEELKAQMDELKNMTEEERKAFFEQNKTKGVSILNEMVEEGIISADQAEKLAEKMPKPGHFGQRNCDSLPGQQE